jgi:hypothetical protein
MANAQKVKFDTTMKIGKVGYRVLCNNKKPTKNNLSINLIGFEETRDEISFEVMGKVVSCEIDDLNRDGYTDLLIYVVDETNNNKASVVAIASTENKGIRPIIFPDIRDDAKLNAGYNGGDTYKLMNGMLSRRFPVVDASKNVLGYRKVFYTVMPDEKGMLHFKVLRSLDEFKKD